MKTVFEKIVDQNNLYWAWEKAKNFYKPGDIWFNELEVAAFEADLSNQLSSIREDVLDNSYQLSLIYPIAYPKGAGDSGPRTRQTFWISVRDQVTWLAVCNIIGPYLDSKMPFWSYGNRLYISTFFSRVQDSDTSNLKFGYYRNTTRNTYRKWKQSWPLYRRHVHLTSQYLTKERNDFFNELDPQEQDVLSINDMLLDHPLKAHYLDDDYWEDRVRSGLYWAGLDLTKFYPSLNVEKIKTNISEFLNRSIISPELELLIARLFNFKMNCTGWTEEELDHVGLAAGDQKYPHLPTGLFVAGFLANVALLHVDKQVQKELHGNRNIAHFRYVDDHVILANSFEQLIEWIDFYTSLLEDSDIGTSFNSEKTEPIELRRYLELRDNETDNSEEIGKTRETAKRSTSLDPDFPSPLMTKTLGKVSKIAGTTFDLLTPNQENDLIEDIEHLLVTEFPDQELPQDTRVSFAASMLASIIPKVKQDSSEAYVLERDICNLDIIIAKKKSEFIKHKRSNAKDGLRAELLAMKTKRRTCVSKLEEEKERLNAAEQKLITRTIKLLSRAVQDNHEKVRLWGRLLDFFLKTGTGTPTMIFSELRKLSDRAAISNLSLTFIRSFILQILTSSVFSAINILGKYESSIKVKERARRFLINVFREDTFEYFDQEITENSKFYEKVSLQSFKFASGITISILNDDLLSIGVRLDNTLIRRFRLLNVKRGAEGFVSRSSYDAGVWSWWYLNRISVVMKGDKPFFWNEINGMLDYGNDIDLNSLLLYPRYVTKSQLRRLDAANNEQLPLNEGVLFEISKKFDLEYLKNLAILKAVVSKLTTGKTYISLEEWVDWMQRRQFETDVAQNSSHFFDPRLGEWMSLEITKLIALDLRSQIEEDTDGFPFYKYLHPHNFKIPRAWVDGEQVLDWGNLFEMISKFKYKVGLRAKDVLILDNRLIPQLGDASEVADQILVQGLGTLLVALLSKDTELPSGWNPIGLQQARLSLVKLKLKDVAVSTYTNDILSGCFSKRNIETIFNIELEQPDFSYSDDTEYDPPIIKNIDNLIDLLNFAQSKLRGQQLSVSNHQPRQLTPINLMQFKQEVYQNEIIEDEI